MLRKSSIRDRNQLKQALVRDEVSKNDALAQGMSDETFNEIDADGDGVLTASEILGWNSKKQMEADNTRLQQMLARDVVRMSHDDAIEQGMSEATFKSIDADGDGHLTAAEISAWKDQHPTGLSDGDGGGGGVVGGGASDGGMTLEEMFDIAKTHAGASGADASVGRGGRDGAAMVQELDGYDSDDSLDL
jgi:hypothetical protein